MDENKKIGLVLSGGGVRAMVYHAGVIKWLAEHNQLKQITDISTVSGGSLFIGLVLRLAHWKWPDSQEFLNKVYPKLREILIADGLQEHLRKMMFNPRNWKHAISRANLLANAIEDLWDIRNTLQDIPSSPAWSINGTTAETGKRFRFKKGKCGDYELGYADSKHFNVSEAIASSAAYPFLIGPFSINADKLVWYKKEKWESDIEPEEVILPFQKLHIIDGGIYDNLGMEPFFDVGAQKPKSGAPDMIVVSDAGAPLTSMPFGRWDMGKRLLNITMAQARALRIRVFINYLKNNSGNAKYIQLGTDPRDIAKQYPKKIYKDFLETHDWLTKADIKVAASYPTDLKRISQSNFDIISRHGYETAKWNTGLFV